MVRYVVVLADGEVVFSSTSKPTAEWFAGKYDNAKVEEVQEGDSG